MRDTLIHIIDIKGYGRPDVLLEALDTDTTTLEALLAQTLADAILQETRMGLRLTPAGRAEAAQLLQRARSLGDATAMEALYAGFEPLNHRFKSAMARWQMRETEFGAQPNDHQDAAYDALVMAELLAQHDELLERLYAAADSWSLLPLYAQRLTRARARVTAGEARYLAAPLIESYHTVWFELHEALIRYSGRTRAEEAAAGRAV